MSLVLENSHIYISSRSPPADSRLDYPAGFLTSHLGSNRNLSKVIYGPSPRLSHFCNWKLPFSSCTVWYCDDILHSSIVPRPSSFPFNLFQPHWFLFSLIPSGRFLPLSLCTSKASARTVFSDSCITPSLSLLRIFASQWGLPRSSYL